MAAAAAIGLFTSLPATGRERIATSPEPILKDRLCPDEPFLVGFIWGLFLLFFFVTSPALEEEVFCDSGVMSIADPPRALLRDGAEGVANERCRLFGDDPSGDEGEPLLLPSSLT